MEVWLSPALGFDYGNGTARIYGSGTNPITWVSFRDVAEMCVAGLRHPAASRATIEFGGPDPLSPLQVVALFEEISGKAFQCEHVPEVALRAQFEAATDSMQKSFAALMLRYSLGDPIDMGPVVATYGIRLTSVRDYARTVLGSAAAA
jgi:nucleoside-diphosphate-sugar epimerase